MTGIDWPEGFFALPWVTGGLWRADARPCPKCSAWVFLIVETAAGYPTCACPNCCKLKAGDRVLGTLDRRSWTVRRNPREGR